MLRKLLKYEWRSVARQLLPLYVGVLGLALVNHLIWFALPGSQSESGFNFAFTASLGGIPAVATGLAYFAVCVALFVITVILIVQRFYKGLLGEEGYLAFTLPVKTWELIAAKGLIASVLTLLGVIVGMVSIMLLGFSLNDWGLLFRGFFSLPYDEMFREHALWPLYIVETLVLILVSLWGSIGHVYTAIALGHLLKKHRIAGAIVAYVGINMLQSVLLVTFINIDGVTGLGNLLDVLASHISDAWVLHVSLLCTILLQVIGMSIFFFVTNWILSHKLNLE